MNRNINYNDPQLLESLEREAAEKSMERELRRTAQKFIKTGKQFACDYLYVVETIKHAGKRIEYAIQDLENHIYKKSVSNQIITSDSGNTNEKSDPTAKYAIVYEETKEIIVNSMTDELKELQSKWKELRGILLNIDLTVDEKKIFDYKYGDWFAKGPKRPTNIWIAVKLGIAESTVRKYEKELFIKIGMFFFKSCELCE